MKQEKKRSIIYIAVFIGLIMALSVIGFLWGGSGEGSKKYGKFTFSYSNGQWTTGIGGKTLTLRNFPEELQNITVPEDAKIIVSSARMIYITYEKETNAEEMALAQYSLGMNLETNTRFVVNALAYENEENVIVVTCKNATEAVPVILMKKSDFNNSVTLNNGCIVLEGVPSVLADRLVYAAYDIIK